MDREKVIKDNAIRGLQSAIEISGAMVHLRKEHAEALLAILKEKETVVRCKNCKHRPKEPNLETYESGFDLEFPEGSKCPCRCYGDEWYSWYPDDEWFCSNGEPKESR